MKKNNILFAIFLLLIPFIKVSAYTIDNNIIDDDLIMVSQNTKYYKTIEYKNNYFKTLQNENTTTIEITEDEYNNAPINAKGDGGVETTYKKLTSTIYQNGSKYRYKANLNWKNMPSTRSYDIIGIGYYASVRQDTGPYFSLYYCRADGTCTTTTSNYPQIFYAGVGTSFKLPTGSLTTLTATLYFDVVKSDSNSTIVSQIAAADYAHATSSVTANQSMDYTVGSLGITLGSSITNKYDAMSTATATWNGSW